MVRFDSTGSLLWKDLEILEDRLNDVYDGETKKAVRDSLKRMLGQISVILANLDKPGYDYVRRSEE